MAQITINGINVKPTKSDSLKVGIFTKDKDGQEVWINGFLNNRPTWQKGDVVELDVYNDEKWGLQFRLPEGVEDIKQPTQNLSEILERLKSLELRVSVLEGRSDGKTPQNALEANTEAPSVPSQSNQPKEIQVEDLPF